MDGYPPGAPPDRLIDEFATVKSAFPSVVTHSGALEFHSLFCTVYAPPATAAVCELHKVVVAARAGAAAAKTPDAASIATAARMGMSLSLASFTRVFLSRGVRVARWAAIAGVRAVE